MNNTELTFCYAEQMFALSDLLRRIKMIRTLESLIDGSDNEIVKQTYVHALEIVKEGWPC